MRILLLTFVLTLICAPCIVAADPGQGQPAAKAGPALGEWKFTGKDNAGVVWTGKLTLGKVDPDRFNVEKYHSMCNLEAKSASSERGVEIPATYDAATRVFTFQNEMSMGGVTYTAVLSPDGKSLTQGKWRETDKNFGEKEKRVVSTGEWSASIAAK
jgi:hypothetical protein